MLARFVLQGFPPGLEGLGQSFATVSAPVHE